MINRREVLERDPPYDFVQALNEITRLTGWGERDLALVLNVSRGCIRGLLAGSEPRDGLGQAIRKLRASCAFGGLLKATTETQIEA
jgi:hypothetical protein